jgi:FKBP-type peptidyl-prolyl cis-trans isomerase FkpA
MKKFAILIILFIAILSCKKKETVVAAIDTVPAIRQYLKDNNIKADSTPDKVFYILDRPGNGSFPKSFSSYDSEVTVYYKGYRLDGYLFDKSDFNPLKIFLSQVIKGWQSGIPKIDKGGKGRIFIPANLAYGTTGSGGDIAPNTPLIFEVELIDFK